MIPNERCLLCGGAQRLEYSKLGDWLFGVEGQWDIYSCVGCRARFPSPRPGQIDFQRLYRDYHTHVVAAAPATGDSRAMMREGLLQLGAIIGGPAIRDAIRGRVLWLDDLPPGAWVLDVGCGSGKQMAHMERRGLRVVGVEPDERAADAARVIVRGTVHTGFLENIDFGGRHFDAVVASHVLEHVENPQEFVRVCLRLLTPTGRLVLTTPNADSLGARLFRSGWRGLEVPRHLQVLTLESAAHLAADSIVSVRSSARSTAWVWRQSRATSTIQRFAQLLPFRYLAQVFAGLFNGLGEELIIEIRKRQA